jgi:hypothetical protein
MNDKKQKLLILVPTIVCIAALFIVGILLLVRGIAQGPQEKSVFLEKRDRAFEERLRNAARQFGIPDENYRTEVDLEERQVTITIFLPRGKMIEELVMLFFAAVENTEYRVAEANHIHRGRPPRRREYVTMVFENRKRPHERIIYEIIPTNQIVSETARVAFLIKGLDRLSPQNADALLAFGEPLSFILTPWHVKITADSVSTNDGQTVRRRREVIDSVPEIFSKILMPVVIEIPIEDSEIAFERRRYTIMQSDNRRRIEEKMRMLSQKYPPTAGFYSRSGNLVLDSRNISQNFLQALRRQNMLFFDARVRRNRAAVEIAQSINTSYETINLTLPATSEKHLSKEEWEAELKNACDRIVRNKKTVILINSDDNFVEAFVKYLPNIKRRGIQFVPITHL